MLTKTDLHNYQKRAVKFIKDNRKCALFLDMGLGKTASTLTAISELIPECKADKILVIAPLRVALSTWHAEIAKWEHLQHLSYTIIRGMPSTRVKKLSENTRIHIISRDLVVWLVNHCKEEWPYDMVVIDESSSFKSAKTQRFKAMRKVLSQINRMVLLTGTPASNGLLDLWSQVYLIDQGKRLYKTYYAYLAKFFYSDHMGYNWRPRGIAQQEITSRIQDICLSMSASDYLELPDVMYADKRCELDQSTAREYKSFKKEFFMEHEGEIVTASSAAVLVNKLMQFCNGAVYTQDRQSIVVKHNQKLDVLEEVIEELQGQNVLIAYNFQTDRDRILKRFKQAQVLSQDPTCIERWNRGEIPMLLAHPASCGHGLNIQHGGNHIIWFGLTWSLEMYLQMNARLHRQGQDKPVIITHIIASGTVDELVLEALKNKDINQQRIIDALKK
jgi:SNF2 family DNA or RNA helicase